MTTITATPQHLNAAAEVAAAMTDGSLGRLLVECERTRQIRDLGFDAAHDLQQHGSGRGRDLLNAAWCYEAGTPARWPWPREAWKPKHPLRNLVRAGALLRAAVALGEATRDAVLIGRAEPAALRVEQRIDRLMSDAYTTIEVARSHLIAEPFTFDDDTAPSPTTQE